MEIRSKSTRRIGVNVLPPVNRVQNGDTAIFECDVIGAGNEPVVYTWNTHYSILKDKRFRLERDNKIVHVLDVEDVDNDRSVSCTATLATKGFSVEGIGKIVVLPSGQLPTTGPTTTSSALDAGQTTIRQRVSKTQVKPGGHENEGFPDVTVAGTVLMSGALILLIVAISAIVCFLRRARGKGSSHNSDLITETVRKPRKDHDGKAKMEYDHATYDTPVPPIYHEDSCYEVPPKSPQETPPVMPVGPPDIIAGRGRLYTPTRTQRHPNHTKHLHKSMPSLHVSNDTEVYEEMESGKEASTATGAAACTSNLQLLCDDYDHIARSNPGSLNEFAIPRSRSTASHYSNLSTPPSYDNMSIVSQHSARKIVPDNCSDNKSYENCDAMDRQPLFELCAEDDRRLKYVSLYLDDGEKSKEVPASPNKPKTSYATIRHIIKVLRTRRGTNVEIVDC